ncbi:hypothetical protein HY837_02680 [archaeon]|nr:hypothetical protein [archaeon]
MNKKDLTRFVVYGSVFAGSFGAGFYKGSADAKGINLPGISDIALLCAPPIIGGIASARLEARLDRKNYSNPIEAVVDGIFQELYNVVNFVGGGMSAAVFEAAGYGTGYLINCGGK